MRRHVPGFVLALAGAFILALAPLSAQATACTGRDLMAELSPDERAGLRVAVDAVPHARGLFWRAEKDGARITLIGTYHFGDARHDAIADRFAPEIAAADALLVEAGPEEEAALAAALAENPALMLEPEGPTLPERLSEAEWQRLSGALAERGIPAVVASRMRPWYVATMLGLSPCMLQEAAARGGETGGLDHKLIERALAADVPVRALEPHDTVLRVFGDMTGDEEFDMIRAALPAAEHADDYATTLIEAYFAEDAWMLWEFGRHDAYENSGLSREAVDAQMTLAKRELMDERNAAWMAPLTGAAEAAATRGKAVVAGFGALHLPGEDGVLRLLERDGWTVSRIE